MSTAAELALRAQEHYDMLCAFLAYREWQHDPWTGRFCWDNKGKDSVTRKEEECYESAKRDTAAFLKLREVKDLLDFGKRCTTQAASASSLKQALHTVLHSVIKKSVLCLNAEHLTGLKYPMKVEDFHVRITGIGPSKFQLKRGRTVILGDPHGCKYTVESLLRKINFNPDVDNLFHVGDVVDGQLHSNECIKLLQQYHARGVLGNHESDHLLKLDHLPLHVAHKYKHGSKTKAKLTPASKAAIREWPLTITLSDYGIVITHAGVLPGMPGNSIVKQKPQDLLYARKVEFQEDKQCFVHADKLSNALPWHAYYQGAYGHVIFGHDAQKDFCTSCEYATGLDLGAGYAEFLGACILPPVHVLHDDADFMQKMASGRPPTRADLKMEFVSELVHVKDKQPKYAGSSADKLHTCARFKYVL